MYDLNFDDQIKPVDQVFEDKGYQDSRRQEKLAVPARYDPRFF